MPTVNPQVLDGTILRDMTDAELQQREEDVIESAREAKIASDKAIAKQAVLDKLGLTADEVTALLG